MAVLHANDLIHRDSDTSLFPTELPDAFFETDMVRQVLAFHMPRFDELPRIELYKEQVLTYVEGVFSPLSNNSEDAWLTSSMVNNYVKIGLIPAPIKKAYTSEHIARLLAICIFKQLLPISNIHALLEVQASTYDLETAYNYFATEFEHALKAVFSDRPVLPDTAQRTTRETQLVRCATSAIASKIFLQAYLSYIQ